MITPALAMAIAVLLSFSSALRLVYTKKIKAALVMGSAGFTFCYAWLQILSANDWYLYYSEKYQASMFSGSDELLIKRVSWGGLPTMFYDLPVYIAAALLLIAAVMHVTESRRSVYSKRSALRKQHRNEMEDLRRATA